MRKCGSEERKGIKEGARVRVSDEGREGGRKGQRKCRSVRSGKM